MRSAFGSSEAPLASERWDWMFLNSPTNSSKHYLVADAGERLAGQFATIPVRLQHNHGESVLGLLAVDMATDPAFQRQGVFAALAQQLYADTTDEAPVVFGFPNSIAAPIHYGRFEWVELLPVPLLIRPLGNLRLAMEVVTPRFAPVGRLLDVLMLSVRAFERASIAVGERTSVSVRPFENFAPWADDLWAQLAPDLGTCVVRDAAYLNWRFCAAPYSYRRYALYRGEKPIGFIVTTFCPTRFGKLCYLMELMVPKAERAGAHLLLTRVFIDAAREGASGICTIATRRHPHRGTMLSNGFVPAPNNLKTHLSFGVRHNGRGAVPNCLFHINDWYLSGADRDTM
jgi:hypothetical protein